MFGTQYVDRTHEFATLVDRARHRRRDWPSVSWRTFAEALSFSGAPSQSAAFDQTSRAAARAYDALAAHAASHVPREQLRTAAIAATQVALRDAPNEQTRMHYSVIDNILASEQCNVQPIQIPAMQRSRLTELETIRRKLTTISAQYTTIMHTIAEHDIAIDGVERRVDRCRLRVDAAHQELQDAAPRAYRTWRRYVTSDQSIFD